MPLQWPSDMDARFSPTTLSSMPPVSGSKSHFPGESEEVKEETKPKRRRRGYSEYSLDDLTAMLDKVIGEEDYEKAAKIRDEINKRKEEESSEQ